MRRHRRRRTLAASRWLPISCSWYESPVHSDGPGGRLQRAAEGDLFRRMVSIRRWFGRQQEEESRSADAAPTFQIATER